MKRIVAVALALLFVAALGACSRAKAPAEQAIKAAEEALNSVKAEAVKYVPEQVKGVEDSLKAAKDSFAKGEYEAAATAASAVVAKAKDLLTQAAAKKAELTKSWEELSASLPNSIEEIKGRVEALSRSRKLPKGLDKAKLESAKNGLAEIGNSWSEAKKAFGEGSLAAALEKAKGLREKAAEIMSTLGMKSAEGSRK